MQRLLAASEYYTLFGLEPGAGTGKVRKAYYDLSRRYHPDRFYRDDLGDDAQIVEEVFAGINLAYRTLSVPAERKKFHRSFSIEDQSTEEEIAAAEEAEAVQQEQAEEEVDGHTVRFDVGDKKRAKDKAPKGERKKRTRTKKGPAKATPAAVQALKKRLMLRLRKARRYYKAGVEEAEAGQWVKAASSFYLATQYAPKNEEYKRRFADANMRGRQVQADLILQAGRSAEDYGSLREAVSHYQRAVEIKPPHGAPYFRLGRALRRLDNMDRAALDNLRTAVTNTPNTLEFRMELAACFEDHGMTRNANREYKAAMDLDRSNEEAKAGFKRTR